MGTANGANRIAIVIPCHRVIAADGGLGGYGGGLWRKLRLLELEGGARRLRRRPRRPPADRRAPPRFALATRGPYHATSSRMSDAVRRRLRLTTGGTE